MVTNLTRKCDQIPKMLPPQQQMVLVGVQEAG